MFPVKQRKRVLPLLLVIAAAAVGEESRSQPLRVTAVRHWSLEGVTRVAVEVSGDFEFRTERLHNPERVFFDILNSRPSFDGKRANHHEVGDRLLNKVRIAETQPGVTRVVLDLTGTVAQTASKMGNPSRLVIELRPAQPEQAAPVSESAEARKPAEPTPVTPHATVATPPSVAEKPALPAAVARKSREAAPDTPAVLPPAVPAGTAQAKTTPERNPQPAVITPSAVSASKAAPEKSPQQTASRKPAETAATPRPVETAPVPKPAPSEAAVLAPPSLAETGTAASRKSDGKNSLIRALGLKINRVVIDPGHGGHDQGTVGKRGLMEKELVLDVAKRLGELMQQQIGCEVVYTRTDDIFVPLEGRTALANERKADLFISLHANSSGFSRIAGVETFYLNFTNSRDALDVAARENASSQKSISELQDLLQKIARQEKTDESKELAGRIQSSMFAFSARYNPGIRNRGVKMAPFVVLVGAQMPSVLVEIGFLSNTREETLLKRPDHRQRVAEALLKGISRYTQGLSHFQVAAAAQAKE